MKLEAILVKRVMVVLVVHYMYAKEILLPNLKHSIKLKVLHFLDNNSDNQQDFIENNVVEHEKASFKPLTDEGKLFSGGPTCMFKGKVIPCFTHRSESGGVSSTILKELFETIDQLNLLPRSLGVISFSILDGHGSRLELPFLIYSNASTTE